MFAPINEWKEADVEGLDTIELLHIGFFDKDKSKFGMKTLECREDSQNYYPDKKKYKNLQAIPKRMTERVSQTFTIYVPIEKRQKGFNLLRQALQDKIDKLKKEYEEKIQFLEHQLSEVKKGETKGHIWESYQQFE